LAGDRDRLKQRGVARGALAERKGLQTRLTARRSG
jgi:hypothetical protein